MLAGYLNPQPPPSLPLSRISRFLRGPYRRFSKLLLRSYPGYWGPTTVLNYWKHKHPPGVTSATAVLTNLQTGKIPVQGRDRNPVLWRLFHTTGEFVRSLREQQTATRNLVTFCWSGSSFPPSSLRTGGSICVKRGLPQIFLIIS